MVANSTLVCTTDGTTGATRNCGVAWGCVSCQCAMIPSSADTCVSDGTTDAATNYWFTGNNTGGMITIPIDTCASDRTTGAAKKVRFTDPAGHGRWLRAPG